MFKEELISHVVALKAATEEAAVQEALAKYREISSKSYQVGDFRVYPRNPNLSFQVDPDEWLTKTFVTEIERGI